MRTGTSFARDWQLIKVARSLREHDVTGSLLRRLLKDAPPGLMERVTAIAERLGEEDGTALLSRAEERFDPPTLMEGLLLTWGVPSESTETAEGGVLLTIDCTAAAVRDTFADARVAGPYLAGYARALQPDAVFERGGHGRVTIRFPPRER
jgi:hypothetical protein